MPVKKERPDQFIPAWVIENGPSGDVALSTRARLARNIEGIAFPCRAKDADLRRASEILLDAAYQAGQDSDRLGRLRIIRPRHFENSTDRLALVDTRLASRQHVSGGKYRAVVLNEAGTLSLMVNEEDHVRMQCILPGFQPMTALRMVQEYDRLLQRKIAWARADNYGYLTSSIANVGTGLRLSAMLHLPGLAFLGEAVSVLTAAAELKISVRGLLGEGTRALGDIFQVSNETTIGFTEKEITSRVSAVATHLVSREREARRRVASRHSEELRDAARRATEFLADARFLNGTEAMACISILRLGSELGLGPPMSQTTFKELLASMRLGVSGDGRPSSSRADDAKRAARVRQKFFDSIENLQLTRIEAGEPYSERGRQNR